MKSHHFDCTDCPNFDVERTCCHQSLMPALSLNMAHAVEVAQKHEFDRVNFNRRRFALPNYIYQKDNKK
jgi:hypothetical protein